MDIGTRTITDTDHKSAHKHAHQTLVVHCVHPPCSTQALFSSLIRGREFSLACGTATWNRAKDMGLANPDPKTFMTGCSRPRILCLSLSHLPLPLACRKVSAQWTRGRLIYVSRRAVRKEQWKHTCESVFYLQWELAACACSLCTLRRVAAACGARHATCDVHAFCHTLGRQHGLNAAY